MSTTNKGKYVPNLEPASLIDTILHKTAENEPELTGCLSYFHHSMSPVKKLGKTIPVKKKPGTNPAQTWINAEPLSSCSLAPLLANLPHDESGLKLSHLTSLSFWAQPACSFLTPSNAELAHFVHSCHSLICFVFMPLALPLCFHVHSPSLFYVILSGMPGR